MKTFISLGLAATLATVSFAELSATYHDPLPDLNIKRSFLTCQETYGGGSITCGSGSSHYCYDPTLGESCCLLDDGYCKAGDFCAPVAGFCCHNGEDQATCAARLSFTLPLSSSTATATTTELAIASTTPATSTATIEILAVDTSSLAVASATFGVWGAEVSATASTGAMTPDFTAMINQTTPGASSGAGMGAGAIVFKGAASRVDLGIGVGGLLLVIVAVAGLVL